MSAAVFTVRRRDVAWAVALVVLLSAIWVARGDRADAGGAPPGTGIAVVYVAVGTNYPDSLGVGPGGGVNGAPIIIVPTNPPIPTATSVELVRLDPRTVVIIGGTSAVSEAMEDALEALLPNATFSRLAGGNRYETNALFSAANFPVEGWASLSAAGFTADEPDTDPTDIGTSGMSVTVPTGNLFGSIQLPDGAEILELRIWAYDDGGADLTVELRRQEGPNVDLIASVSSSGDAGYMEFSTEVIDAGGAIVDNGVYAYFLQVGGSSGNPALFMVKVRYRLGVPGA